MRRRVETFAYRASHGGHHQFRASWLRRGPVALAAASLALVSVALTGCQPVVLDLVVNSSADAPDASPGNGSCATASGVCTLRAAVNEANATAGLDRVTIAPGVNPVLTVAGGGEDAGATGDLDVTGDLTVVGGGAVVDAGAIDRVFDVVTGHLTLEGLTVRGGSLPSWQRGSAIRSRASLTLDHVNVTGNGRAPLSSEGSSLLVNDSAITDNGSGAPDGALIVSNGTAQVERSLLTDAVLGAYVYGPSSLTVLDSTIQTNGDGLIFSGSAASGSVWRSTLQTTASQWGNFLIDSTSPVTVAGSILDAPSADPSFDACRGTSTSAGYNVVVDDSCAFAATGDIQGVNPLLGALTDNGGPTLSRMPHAGSPALDRIPAGSPVCYLVPLDQRGSTRPVGSGCDAGSVEGSGSPVVPVELTVDTSYDGVDDSPGDGVCDTGFGACTLRAAVMEANATNPDLPSVADTIIVASGIDPVLSLAGDGEDAALTGDLDLVGSLILVGGGTTIDAAGLDRAFDSTAPSLSISGVTITGGEVTGDGGAIRSTAGSVTVTDSNLVSNQASGAGGAVWSARFTGVGVTMDANTAGSTGGGISTTFLDLTRSTLSTNQATGSGGGAHIEQSGSIVESTINNNSASSGGGVAVTEGGYLTVETSTISANHAALDSALRSTGIFGPGLTLKASTIADNTGSPALSTTAEVCTRGCSQWDSVVASGSIILGGGGQPACTGPLGSGSSTNLAPDGSCGTSLAGTGALGPLADNGGTTFTRLPTLGSGAVDTVAVGTPGLCDGSIARDQRGVARPGGPACDLGAVEQ